MKYTLYLLKEELSVAALGEALGHIGQLDPAQFADAGQLGLVAEDVVFVAAGAVVRVLTPHPVQVAPGSPRHVAQQAPSQAVACSALLHALPLQMEGASVSSIKFLPFAPIALHPSYGFRRDLAHKVSLPGSCTQGAEGLSMLCFCSRVKVPRISWPVPTRISPVCPLRSISMPGQNWPRSCRKILKPSVKSSL